MLVKDQYLKRELQYIFRRTLLIGVKHPYCTINTDSVLEVSNEHSSFHLFTETTHILHVFWDYIFQFSIPFQVQGLGNVLTSVPSALMLRFWQQLRTSVLLWTTGFRLHRPISEKHPHLAYSVVFSKVQSQNQKANGTKYDTHYVKTSQEVDQGLNQ